MNKCDFCIYSKMNNGKLECTADYPGYVCKEAISKMSEVLIKAGGAKNDAEKQR